MGASQRCSVSPSGNGERLCASRCSFARLIARCRTRLRMLDGLLGEPLLVPNTSASVSPARLSTNRSRRTCRLPILPGDVVRRRCDHVARVAGEHVAPFERVLEPAVAFTVVRAAVLSPLPPVYGHVGEVGRCDTFCDSVHIPYLNLFVDGVNDVELPVVRDSEMPWLQVLNGPLQSVNFSVKEDRMSGPADAQNLEAVEASGGREANRVRAVDGVGAHAAEVRRDLLLQRADLRVVNGQPRVFAAPELKDPPVADITPSRGPAPCVSIFPSTLPLAVSSTYRGRPTRARRRSLRARPYR